MSQTATDALPSLRRGFAVVDVETTGLDATKNRIIEVAVAQIGPDGEVEERWSTLVRPPGGTGPVHIHGLTRRHLRDAPRFADVVDELIPLLEGRILVAHNARFDWSFLAHEAARAGRRLPVQERLCTVTLARQLGIPARNLKLATLAEFWAVPKHSSHRAESDVSTLLEILRHCLEEAGEQRAVLPLEACMPVTGLRWRLHAHVAPMVQRVQMPIRKLFRLRAPVGPRR